MEQEPKTDPILLEAILRTEKAVFEAHFQASRALEGASIILAVCAEALALGRGFFGHDVSVGVVLPNKFGMQNVM